MSERLRALMEEDPVAARAYLKRISDKFMVPHAGGQQNVLDATERFLVLCAGRRWGKTKVGVKRAIRTARKERRMVWWIAPTYKVVKRGYREVLRQLPPDLLSKPPPQETAFDAGRSVVLEFKNGSRMEFYSAERPEGMLGEGVDLAVLDEAATMPETVWTQIVRPTLADRQGHALFISTPRGKNWFHGLYRRGQDPLEPNYKSWRFPSWTNPTIPATEWEDARKDTPQVIYDQEYAALFISKAAAVFRFEDDAIKPEHPPAGHVFMGVDLAKSDDYTVLAAVRERDRLPCFHDRFNTVSWPEQKRRIREVVRGLEADGADAVTLIMDSTGVGDPIVEDLEAEGYDVVGIKFTDIWKRKAVTLLGSDLEEGNAFLQEEQREEHENYGYKITDAGRWRFEAINGHDDEVSAKLLQHWGMIHEGAPDAHDLSGGELDEDDFEDEPESDFTDEELQLATPAELMANPAVWN